ncbi:putative aspartyl protease [Dysgonomonas hofstadii]|uniref:Putative aspartyl protease n=1 Tax=Dysgonomonas hofstadii TaxID=637886 RepID=A0A840CSY7_9BACT|nr:retropepsin-like aspartic protease [Dysgonomonas hofstadii]MBB4035652.1 putative aspartyl protease [Dysgonomonas hofstadii]
MNYRKILSILVLFIISVLSGSTQISEDSIKANLYRLSIGLKNKDITAIKKNLDPDFSLSTENWPRAKYILEHIIKNNNFESVELTNNELRVQEDSVVLVNVKFNLENGKTEESVIAINRDNMILFIDYFDHFAGHSRFKDSKLLGILPFNHLNGYIILKIKINDNPRELLFLLDTGADGIAIRKTLADSLSLSISHSQNTSVVGTQIQVNISGGNTIHLSDSISLKNQNIAIFETIDSFDGIIGLNLVSRFITNINFDENQIYLYSFGNYRYTDNGKTFPISKPSSSIVVPSLLNLTGKKEITGNFIIDTGANYYLILFEQYVRKNRLLLSGFKPEGEATTVSMGYSSPVFYGKASEFKLDNEISQKNMPITLQASKGGVSKQDNDSPDGSIGIKFFSNYNFTIDLLRKQIHLVPRKQLED